MTNLLLFTIAIKKLLESHLEEINTCTANSAIPRVIGTSEVATSMSHQIDLSIDWNGSGGIPWLSLKDILPSCLETADIMLLLGECENFKGYGGNGALSCAALKANSSSSNISSLYVEKTDVVYLVNHSYIRWLLHKWSEDCKICTAEVVSELKSMSNNIVIISDATSNTRKLKSVKVGDDGSDGDDNYADEGTDVAEDIVSVKESKGKSKRSVEVEGEDNDGPKQRHDKTSKAKGSGNGKCLSHQEIYLPSYRKEIEEIPSSRRARGEHERSWERPQEVQEGG